MGKYSLKQSDALVANINGLKGKLTLEEQRAKEAYILKLQQLGVYVATYDRGLYYPEHPDGIHNYMKDSREAIKLVYANKELPQDLVDRLMYYKPIIDEQLRLLSGEDLDNEKK